LTRAESIACLVFGAALGVVLVWLLLCWRVIA
jgi:hypothetical protein